MTIEQTAKESILRRLRKSSRPQRPLDHGESCEFVAQQFHDTYEELAPEFDYDTRTESRKPWTEVDLNLRCLMTEVVSVLLEKGVIECNATVEEDQQ